MSNILDVFEDNFEFIREFKMSSRGLKNIYK